MNPHQKAKQNTYLDVQNKHSFIITHCEYGFFSAHSFAARSVAFWKWFGSQRWRSGTKRRFYQMVWVPFQNYIVAFWKCIGAAAFQNGSLGRLLKMIRTPFENASLKMSTTFHIVLSPFENWSAAFSKMVLWQWINCLFKIVWPFFEDGPSNFWKLYVPLLKMVWVSRLLKIGGWPPFLKMDRLVDFWKWFDRLLKILRWNVNRLL